MCRFLIIKSTNPVSIVPYFLAFSEECKISKEFQGDGWGVSWISENCDWNLHKGLNPIWDSKEYFYSLPKSKVFVVHARSASNERHKGILEHNQPYLYDNFFSFVSNVSIKGMNLGYEVLGEIGSQKIFNMIARDIGLGLGPSLKNNISTILKSAKCVRGLNVGVVTQNKIFVSSNFNEDPEYFALHYYSNPGFFIMSSVKFEFQDVLWRKIDSGGYLEF